MTQYHRLPERVRDLLGGVSDQGIAHLTEVETDLAQTALLLAEAIEKLGASFMAIHVAVSAQQDAVDLLLEGGTPSKEHLAQLKNIHREIGRHVNAAVTGLQFQDMTSQLIGRSRNHVSGLREVLCVLRETATRIAPGSAVPALALLLTETNAAIEHRKGTTIDALRKAVTQTHLESGDIELF